MLNHLLFVSPIVAASRCFPHVTHQAEKCLWCQDVPRGAKHPAVRTPCRSECRRTRLSKRPSHQKRGARIETSASLRVHRVSVSFITFHHLSSFVIIFHLFNFNSCSFMKAPFSTNVCDTLECNKILVRLIPQSQEAWLFFCAVRIVPAYRMLFYGVLPPPSGVVGIHWKFIDGI